MMGVWKVNEPRLQKLCTEATALRKENFAGSFVLEHIRREYNQEADSLANTAMNVGSRGLTSSTILLNISTFCGIRLAHDFPPVY